MNDIKWSEGLIETFKENLQSDRFLSWQFFGSSKGFVRIYPGKLDASNHYKLTNQLLFSFGMERWR